MITIPVRRFTVWLSHQRERRALIRRGASENAIGALRQAWAEYEGEGSTAA
jgi:hypothetical protein